MSANETSVPHRQDALLHRPRLLNHLHQGLDRALTLVAAPTGYAYDALDRTTVITYPDGEVVTQTYDNRGLPLALIGDSDYVTQTVRRRRLTMQPGR